MTLPPSPAGVRQYDRQFNISVQQEVLPRVSVEVGYARRSWDNIFFTQNRALTSAHYDVINFPIPQHPALPGGGGGTARYQIINQTGQAQFPSNFFTVAPADDVYYWQGVDVNFNARLQNGLTVQGGTSTGKGKQNYCDVWAAFPSLVGGNRLDACDVSDAAAITPILGRPLANNAASVNLNLVKQGEVYGLRVNSFDFRFAKIVRFGGSRATVGIDVYNAFNSNTAIGFATGFDPNNPSNYLRPTLVLDPRFLRFNVSYDF